MNQVIYETRKLITKTKTHFDTANIVWCATHSPNLWYTDNNIESIVNAEWERLVSWLAVNKLSLNDSKIQLIF